MKYLKVFLILFITVQSVQASRYYSSEYGRFIERDPIGYVDGMSLYGGYFAEEFQLDPSGTSLADCENLARAIENSFNNKHADFPLPSYTSAGQPEKTSEEEWRKRYDGIVETTKDKIEQLRKKLKHLRDGKVIIKVECVACKKDIPRGFLHKLPANTRGMFDFKRRKIILCYDNCTGLVDMYSNLNHEYIHGIDLKLKRPVPLGYTSGNSIGEVLVSPTKYGRLYSELRAYIHGTGLTDDDKIINSAYRSIGIKQTRKHYDKWIKDNNLVERARNDRHGLD
jgi:hypothetical protein